MISRACYIQCDRCGDPAEVSTEGAKTARAFARQQGYERLKRGLTEGPRWEDVCPRCLGKAVYDATPFR